MTEARSLCRICQPVSRITVSIAFLLVSVQEYVCMRVNKARHHDLAPKIDIPFGYGLAQGTWFSLTDFHNQARLGVDCDRDIIHKRLLLGVEESRGMNGKLG